MTLLARAIHLANSTGACDVPLCMPDVLQRETVFRTLLEGLQSSPSLQGDGQAMRA